MQSCHWMSGTAGGIQGIAVAEILTRGSGAAGLEVRASVERGFQILGVVETELGEDPLQGETMILFKS